MPRYIVAWVLIIASASFLLEQADAQEPKAAFSEHLIRAKYGYAYGIAAADLDGDGDLDIVSSDTTDDKTPQRDNGTLLWFENDGKGNFTQHIIAKNEPGWFERLAIGDIDGDGRPDVAVVLNRAGSLVWFRNPGKPATQPWQRYSIVNGGLPGAYDVALGDFDGDGKLDAVASSWTRGSRFVWYRNPGKDGFAKEWPAQVIEDKLSETRTIGVADFNGDGRPDLLGTASSASLVVWYENVGKAGGMPAWKKHVIDDKSPGPIHGHPADMDGDGDLDVVMAFGMRDGPAPRDKHEVAWYENVGKPGKGTAWKRHVVGALPSAFEAIAADVDGDGRPDIIATAWGPAGKLVWFRNSAAKEAPWPMHVLKANWSNANQVIAADLNNDKRIDLIATAERGANELRWWRNTMAVPGKKRDGAPPANSKAGEGRTFKAVDHARTIIYHSPQKPGFTSWVGAWIMPDGDLMTCFTQATGPIKGRPQAPKEVQEKLNWPPKGAPDYDMTGLDLKNVHLRSSDAGKTWQQVSADPFKSCMNGVSGEAQTAMANGTILRGVFGFYLPYDRDIPKTGLLQRSSDGTKTWSKPEVLLDAEKYMTWPRRIRVLRDGRIVVLMGLSNFPAGSRNREEFGRAIKPMLVVSSDNGKTWAGPIAAAPKDQPDGWTEEFDVAELANGDLLAVFRRASDAKRWQSVLTKSDKTWLAGQAGPSVLPHSGQPELLATREGPILHVATSGVHWTSDAGKSWHKLDVPGTAYYPRSLQAKDGTIFLFGHRGGDDAYGKVDQAIVMDRLTLVGQ